MRGALKEFVEHNLGAKHLTRDEWISQNTIQVTELFLKNDEQLALVADGTYCFIQRSSNNEFQRDTYSVQKKRHLVKPFVVCAANGTIVEIYGFYNAKQNDAKIMEDILEKDQFLRELLEENDIIIADRGFRDCVKSIKKNYNVDVIIPICEFCVFFSFLI